MKALYNKKFWEELIAYFPLIRHGPHRERRLRRFFIAGGACLPSNNTEVTHTQKLMGGTYGSTPLRRGQMPLYSYLVS
jgi:hypothetical protein